MKRIICIWLCVILCMASVPISAFAAENPANGVPAIPTTGDVWDGSITQPTTLVQKDGVYYYEITKCSELAYIAQTGGDWLSGQYLLTNNLILNDVILTWDHDGTCTNDTNMLLAWTPINEFTGTFNGNGHIISGMYVSSSDDYAGLFGRAFGGTVINTSVVNSYLQSTSTYSYGGVGLIAGYSDNIRNCVSSGVVKGESNNTGGITGKGYIYNCRNYANVYSNGSVGGVAGEALTIKQCTNYGNIYGNGDVGGIVGYNFNGVSGCSNYGNVTGIERVGGIAGSCNSSTSNVNNCYNIGNIYGQSYCGGVVGAHTSGRYPLSNCYNAGIVNSENSESNNIGAIVGSSQYIWGTFEASSCYYLRTENINAELYGCGNVKETLGEDPSGFYMKAAPELKAQSTYADWNFVDIWSIDPQVNGGYPYLQWQESTLSNIEVKGVLLNETARSLAEGDYTYLTATVFPANASNQSITWHSSDTSVAIVTAAGKVTAIAPGTATITVTTTDGGYTANCTVTVIARQAEEYRINDIIVRDSDGTPLTSVPSREFLVSVSITNLVSEGDTIVMLAAYSAEGQYKGLMWVSVEDLHVGATISVTIPIDNGDGEIATLKVFPIASFSNTIPLGSAISFPIK